MQDVPTLTADSILRKLRAIALVHIAAESSSQQLSYSDIASALQIDQSEVELYVIDGEYDRVDHTTILTCQPSEITCSKLDYPNRPLPSESFPSLPSLHATLALPTGNCSKDDCKSGRRLSRMSGQSSKRPRRSLLRDLSRTDLLDNDKIKVDVKDEKVEKEGRTGSKERVESKSKRLLLKRVWRSSRSHAVFWYRSCVDAMYLR